VQRDPNGATRTIAAAGDEVLKPEDVLDPGLIRARNLA
jgi:hypothetical protein